MPTHSFTRSASPQRSFLSRIKAPFGSKARNISDFYIQPDDPHRQYGPGDVVTGSVVLKVAKPFSVMHIVVRLHGFAQVFKTPNSPGDGSRSYQATLAAGKTRKGGGYYGNGFVSLFEDEAVLCGDGRLGEGTYQFNFELFFSRDRLPSSIDFERGTVSYIITSTLTRPSTLSSLSPTTSCDRKVSFVEDIDIAPLYQPKPQTISLEPIPRRRGTKRRPKRTVVAAEPSKDPEAQASSFSTNPISSDGTDVADALEPPRSPVPSDVSFDSCPSSCTGSAADSAAPSARTGESRTENSKRAAGHGTSRKPITATIELQKSGFLRGDNIPMKISVKHTKQVTSLHGVIVTFYRQARVDMHPALPVVSSAKIDDDGLPKSKTGLGGLSLSSQNSSHVYRKDLSQSFASLIINPDTLSAEIKAAVRVPEEVFPSITTVPGSMISFKYYVEVVLDLQGKLAGLDRFLPNAGMMGTALSVGDAMTGRPPEASGSIFAPWGGHFINTEEIRRDKSVVSCVFEVVIGTRDSVRKSPWRLSSPNLRQNNILGGMTAGSEATLQQHPHPGQDVFETNSSQNGHQQYPIPVAPIPTMPEEPQLSEKERMRLAETRLLPSQPPDEAGASSAASTHLPSAPEFPSHAPFPYEPLPHGSAYPPIHAMPQLSPMDSTLSDGTSAPAYEQHDPPTAVPAEDKHDFQRRRLEMERSAPHADEEDLAGEGASAALNFTPNAPVMSEDAFDFHEHSPHHALPKYER
ncbi:hypothetical protein EJ06DRAFT_469006 [Trichodelitschia bisporula]|uniref:Arrestin C-terminal-like domain-containing protein n=1 Tax=Trichodelitschia bisporula TaxID=703511 RepID=A0A6G1IBQ6_9PEZI|nr:hypothetical protein EJ06DRAFT_469006 [Trichodelitschia bisporula]